ncbi:hypothetical protein C8Q74DRAFT_295317 [Fomes fomentarius]|nr:hypothetical protein C8Q74DRAFT_295317 [Fomes fomentarius]
MDEWMNVVGSPPTADSIGTEKALKEGKAERGETCGREDSGHEASPVLNFGYQTRPTATAEDVDWSARRTLGRRATAHQHDHVRIRYSAPVRHNFTFGTSRYFVTASERPTDQYNCPQSTHTNFGGSNSEPCPPAHRDTCYPRMASRSCQGDPLESRKSSYLTPSTKTAGRETRQIPFQAYLVCLQEAKHRYRTRFTSMFNMTSTSARTVASRPSYCADRVGITGYPDDYIRYMG